MKNPKLAGGRGSTIKGSSSAVPTGDDGRKPRWETSKNPPSDRHPLSDSNPPKEDSAGPAKLPAGPSLTAANLPPSIHPLTSAASPPPQPYGFQNLDRLTIVLADGSVRSYFALPPDYPMEPRADKLFHPGLGQGFDPHFPAPGPPFVPDGFREPPPQPFARGGADYWPSLGVDGPAGPAGPSSLKRKYAEEEFAWQRQQTLHYGSSAVNPTGFPSGPIVDALGRPASPSGREHHDSLRLSKQLRLGGEGYEDLPTKRLRPEVDVPPAARDVDKKALKEAFLRMSKTINDSSSQKKIYLEDGKNGPLQCIVCGRGSKEFADVHDLIMHTYNSQNSDLRIDHLGLHKALCILLGWNYAEAPDTSKRYQSLSADDASANREDLILWPPTVVIHNTNTGKRKDGRMEGLGNKEMDIKLKELGFGGGKAKSVYGKDGHMGITIVKFTNTEVGLSEAEKLADFLERENCGRRVWALVHASQSGTNDEKNPDLVKVDRKTGEKNRVFYGYLATAMDIDKLDFDTRKKVVIKSRRELDLTD